ncbi:MAG: sigma-70 family RNA polymerase sigma factor [Acidobacteria bacterium]|nr:sigma-70 family RNA polymerase sigma factor [Acidobacteriota bacterium]
MSTTTLVMAEEAAPKTETLEFQALYEQYSGAVYLTALRVTGNPADAEDVLQTVFLHVLDARRALDASRSPGAYVRRAAANASIDLLRRKKTRREAALEEGRASGERQGAAVVPGATAGRAGWQEDSFLLKERLRTALTTLSPENAELFVLCYLEGYSYDELAELLQLERGTVGSRLHRIRAALQVELSR